MATHYEIALRDESEEMAGLLRELLAVLRANTEWSGDPERRARRLIGRLDVAKEMDALDAECPQPPAGAGRKRDR